MHEGFTPCRNIPGHYFFFIRHGGGLRGRNANIYIYKRLEEKCNHISDNTKMNTVVPVKRKTLGKQSQRILFNLYQHQWHGTRQPLLGYYPGTLSCNHYSDVIMSAMVSQITGVSIVYTAACSSADQRKRQTIHVTGLCEGNSAVTTEFPAPRASDAENVSIWWRHHDHVSSRSGTCRFSNKLQWLDFKDKLEHQGVMPLSAFSVIYNIGMRE